MDFLPLGLHEKLLNFVSSSGFPKASTETRMAVVVGLLGLLLHCFYVLEKVQPTTENIEKDISRRPPWPIRLIGGFLDMLPWTAWDVSNADVLLQQGSQYAGLPPDYSPLVKESIYKFCDSVKSNDTKLNWVGRKNMHFIITSGLSQYLQVHQLAKDDPDLVQTKLNNPIFVVGLPRSGTTLMHRLLSESSTTECMYIPLWEHFFPVPPKKGLPDLRQLNMHLQFYGWKFIANQYGMDSMHLVRPQLADECHFSLRLAGASIVLWNLAPVFDYCDWLMNEAACPNLRHAYDTYRIVLQMIQARYPNKRLVLKCPSHSLNVHILKEIIPEARLVITHRDPCKTALSYCSLNVRMQAAGCHSVDWRRSVRVGLQKDVASSEKLVRYFQESALAKSEDTNKDEDVYHVSYRKLVSQHVDTVASIHRYFGLPMSELHEKRIVEYLRKNAQNSRGIHRYSYDGMGVDKLDLDKRFAAYKEFFAEYL